MLKLRKRLENTLVFMKHELDESNGRVRELHAAYLASKHCMDCILRFTALSHPVLSYYMRCMRNDHEVRRRFLIRRLIEEQNDDIELLSRALREARADALVDSFGEQRRRSARQLEAENKALRIKLVELRRYISKIERRVHRKSDV
jgi:hypothetical protein